MLDHMVHYSYLYLPLFILMIIPIVGAFMLEWRQASLRTGSQKPYRWGYFTGLQVLGFYGYLALEPNITLWFDLIKEFPEHQTREIILHYVFSKHGLISLLWGSIAACGYFCIRRRRWAWIMTTIATLNPLVWIINYIYGANRWSEFR